MAIVLFASLAIYINRFALICCIFQASASRGFEYVRNPEFIRIHSYKFDKEITIKDKNDIALLTKELDKYYFLRTKRLDVDDKYISKPSILYVSYPYKGTDSLLLFVKSDGMVSYFASLGGGPTSGIQGYRMKGYRDATIALCKKYGLEIECKN